MLCIIKVSTALFWKQLIAIKWIFSMKTLKLEVKTCDCQKTEGRKVGKDKHNVFEYKNDYIWMKWSIIFMPATHISTSIL